MIILFFFVSIMEDTQDSSHNYLLWRTDEPERCRHAQTIIPLHTTTVTTQATKQVPQ